MSDTIFYAHILGVIVVLISAMIIIGAVIASRIDRFRQYEKIWIGMPAGQMLKVMGDRYKKTMIKGRYKYTWKIVYPGIKSRYKRAKKVSIFTKDDLVDEIKPYNI